MFFRINFKIKFQSAFVLFFFLIEFFLIIIFFNSITSLSYTQMAMVSIVQLILNLLALKFLVKLDFISIPCMFVLFTCIFHCGEILKYGFDMPGTDYFPLEIYASNFEISKAFIFYLLSQVFLFLGIGVSIKPSQNSIYRINQLSMKLPRDSKKTGKILFGIGILPRLFLDVYQLYISSKSGYMALFTENIPQFVSTLAFFFDAGAIYLLISESNKEKTTTIFWCVLLYKAFTMLSGSRQDKVCFLLIWIYIYYLIKSKLNIRKILVLIIMSFLGFYFISSIGAGRVNSNIEFGGFLSTINTLSYTIGSSLSEFGSAFNTLVLAVKYTPSNISYGFGLSFVAAIVSCVPLLVSKIPLLADKTIFITQLPGSIYHSLGGSFLGELFYNFSWTGPVFCILIGSILGKSHYGIKSKDNNLSNVACLYSAIVTAMFLYVRGYATDMGQKIIWLSILLLILKSKEKKKISFNSNS